MEKGLCSSSQTLGFWFGSRIAVGGIIGACHSVEFSPYSTRGKLYFGSAGAGLDKLCLRLVQMEAGNCTLLVLFLRIAGVNSLGSILALKSLGKWIDCARFNWILASANLLGRSLLRRPSTEERLVFLAILGIWVHQRSWSPLEPSCLFDFAFLGQKILVGFITYFSFLPDIISFRAFLWLGIDALLHLSLGMLLWRTSSTNTKPLLFLEACCWCFDPVVLCWCFASDGCWDQGLQNGFWKR